MVRRLSSRRRGLTSVQWAVVAALVFLVTLAGVSLIGNRTSVKLDQTGQDLANPSNLTKRFGN